jgi:hypothetical protein
MSKTEISTLGYSFLVGICEPEFLQHGLPPMNGQVAPHCPSAGPLAFLQDPKQFNDDVLHFMAIWQRTDGAMASEIAVENKAIEVTTLPRCSLATRPRSKPRELQHAIGETRPNNSEATSSQLPSQSRQSRPSLWTGWLPSLIMS